MEQTEKKTTMVDTIRNKRIKVQPIQRAGGWLTSINAQHDGAFMYTGARTTYCLPYNLSKRAFENPFSSEEERTNLEKELDLEAGALNIYKKTDNYWKKFTVKVGKDGLVLELRNPEDYLRYLMLKANKEQIAGSWSERFDFGTYKFALVDEDIESIERAKKSNTVRDAYKAMGRMEDSTEAMINFLTVYGKKPGKSPSKEFLTAELDKLIENDLDGFMTIANDENFETKLLVERAIQVGALSRPTKTRYELPGGDHIGSSMADVVAYLKDPLNQENYLQIKNRVEVAE